MEVIFPIARNYTDYSLKNVECYSYDLYTYIFAISIIVSYINIKICRANFKILHSFSAGSAVDDFIQQLVPLLEAGDIIIDGGNSEYVDTNRRTRELKEKKILYIGTGVSGGEDGARYGPSLMPGGNPEAWPHVKDIFQVGLLCSNLSIREVEAFNKSITSSILTEYRCQS